MTADAREPMKNCPFCGQPPRSSANAPQLACCPTCTRRIRIDAWNRRTPGANVQALVKAARAYAKHETVYYRWKLEEVLAAFPEEQ